MTIRIEPHCISHVQPVLIRLNPRRFWEWKYKDQPDEWALLGGSQDMSYQHVRKVLLLDRDNIEVVINPSLGYEVVFNDYQRQMIAYVLEHAIASGHIADNLRRLPGQLEDNALQEAMTFLAMLDGMPTSEHNSPGVTHGLCL